MLTKPVTFGRSKPASRRPPASVSAMALVGAVVTGIATLMAGATNAQEWPSRPVKILVPYGPGGVTDIQARLTADRLSKIYGQPFVVESRPGGAGAVGLEAAMRSPADGYTFLFAGSSMFLTLSTTQKINYDPAKAFAPVSIVGSNPAGVAVLSSFPAKSMADLIAYSKAHPGKMNYSVSAIGNITHYAPALYSQRMGLDWQVIPYNSGPAAMTAMLSGNVQMYFGNTSDIIEHVKSGSAKMLAVSTEKRQPAFPDVPTVSESSPGYVMIIWNGYFAPAGTPQAIIDKMGKAVAEISKEPEIVKKLDAMGIDAMGTTPAEMGQLMVRDAEIFQAAVDAAGLRRKE